jgi:hypothetical protein
MRLRSGSNGARGAAGFAAGFARIARLSALLTLSLLALGATALNFAPVAHADSVSLAILVPKTQSNTAEGPVGTNVTISGQGATAGHGYQLSAALTGPGCPTGGPLGTATADANGKFTTTVEWPDTASAVGATYVICYKDTSAGPALAQDSDQKFKVDAGSPPSITLAPPPSSTPDTGNPSDTYPLGGPIQISGKNYFSNHTQLLAFVTLHQDFAPADLQPGNALKRVDTNNTGFTADANGSFTVTVKLPTYTGNVFLQVVSNDGGSKYLPALIATQPITIGQAATPTPTVGPTVTPTVGSTPPPNNGGGSNNNVDAAGLVGVLSLGGLSVLLFILGVYLLTSTGATHRNL